jgi:thiamine transport system ATP-binding protein
MSELSLRDVVVRYEERVAVAGVSLDIASGETVAVLGPSGCGKSSLLRAIAGLEPLVAGTVALGGVDLAGLPTHRRGVGLMFQDHALFAHMSVARNVGFGLRMAKWPRAQAVDRVDAMLAMVGLPDRGSDDVAELSGGEQQRVALARTLAPRPAVVLLDEPLGSLDRVMRRELIVTLSEAFRATAATVLYVTHDREEAFALADRVAVMRAGRIEQSGTVAELMTVPRNDWVADFLRD